MKNHDTLAMVLAGGNLQHTTYSAEIKPNGPERSGFESNDAAKAWSEAR